MLPWRNVVAVLAVSCVSVPTNAAGMALNGLTDDQLQGRWNQQAGLYDKTYQLSNCNNTRTPVPGRSALICHTTGTSGVVAFQRKAGRLDSVQFMPQGNPSIDASMFLRFVRASAIGDMGAVGARLLTRAKVAGRACVTEDAAEVCAVYDAGEFSLVAR